MKRLVSLFISVALLTLLWWKVDVRVLGANLAQTHWGLFAAAIAFFIPQILTIAWRWKRLVTPFAELELGDSARMVLASSTMNLVLPGKMGDLTKGWFLARRGAVSTSTGIGVVVFEKMLDVAALALFMVAGVAGLWISHAELPVPMASLILAAGIGLAAIGGVVMLYLVPLNQIPGFAKLQARATEDQRAGKIARMFASSHQTMETLRKRGARRGEIVALSLFIWVLHLAQIYLFFRCLGVMVPVGQFLSMVPLAIFIGLLPISIAGFGTRDAALVALLPGLPASGVVAAAFYINLRYILPALAGLPYLARFSGAAAKVTHPSDPRPAD